jgi:hypothetical protein
MVQSCRSLFAEVLTGRQHAQTKRRDGGVPEMPVSRQDDGCASRQGAVDIRVVLGIIEKGPKTEPRLNQLAAGTECIKHAVDLVGPDSGCLTEDSWAFQDALVFQDDRWRDGERHVPDQHPSEDRMRCPVAGAECAQENVGIGDNHSTRYHMRYR